MASTSTRRQACACPPERRRVLWSSWSGWSSTTSGSTPPLPGEDTTPRALLSRLVGQLHLWSAAIAGEEYDFAVERAEPLAHVRERLAVVGPAFVTQVREIRTVLTAALAAAGIDVDDDPVRWVAA